MSEASPATTDAEIVAIAKELEIRINDFLAKAAQSGVEVDLQSTAIAIYQYGGNGWVNRQSVKIVCTRKLTQ